MVEPTWDVDMAVAEAISELEGISGADLSDVAQRLNVPVEEVGASLHRLASDDYVTFKDSSTMGGFDAYAIRLRGKARRLVEQWPSEEAAYRRLLDLLGERAATEDDPERSAALERAKDFLQTAGSAAVGSVLHTLWRTLAGM